MSQHNPINDTVETLVDCTPALRDAALTSLFAFARQFLGFAPKNSTGGFVLGHTYGYTDSKEKNELYATHGKHSIIIDGACRRVRRKGRTVSEVHRYDGFSTGNPEDTGVILTLTPYKTYCTYDKGFNQQVWGVLKENGWEKADYHGYTEQCEPMAILKSYLFHYWESLIAFAKQSPDFSYHNFVAFMETDRVAC